MSFRRAEAPPQAKPFPPASRLQNAILMGESINYVYQYKSLDGDTSETHYLGYNTGNWRVFIRTAREKGGGMDAIQVALNSMVPDMLDFYKNGHLKIAFDNVEKEFERKDDPNFKSNLKDLWQARFVDKYQYSPDFKDMKKVFYKWLGVIEPATSPPSPRPPPRSRPQQYSRPDMPADPQWY